MREVRRTGTPARSNASIRSARMLRRRFLESPTWAGCTVAILSRNSPGSAGNIARSVPSSSPSRLIDEHGAEASIHAAMRADAMLDNGDLDGQRVWLRILKAAKELLNSRPSKGAAIH